MTALPQISRFIDSNITEGDFKIALSEQRDYLSGLLGEDGKTNTARATLKVPLSSIAEKTADYTAKADDSGKVLRFTGNTALALSLDAATALGSGWSLTVINDTSSAVIIDPYLGEVIDGQETYIINVGGRAGIVCDGTRIYTTVPAVPDSVAYATNANHAVSADYAGSVGGISNPMSRDTGAGGIGSIVLGYLAKSNVPINGTVSQISACALYVNENSGISIYSNQTYGGTWRNIGSQTYSFAPLLTMWQRIA